MRAGLPSGHAKCLHLPTDCREVCDKLGLIRIIPKKTALSDPLAEKVKVA
jgi:hypothetical protein